MSFEQLTEAELSNVALPALVNSLKMQGFDLEIIFNEYNKHILDNKLSGAAPQHKHASIQHLKNMIDDAKANSLL
ncbi:hypothetical protein NUJ08_03435 [Acinetobacter pittii]|uniref:hypothetical protein n=1 Tax=Acinetobacter TaxID=469 RepID=UPI00214D7226|nr:hypothetical protein [Acinetobacter pittii]MCR3924256.1 hypothetical protein [Acinetobacter pittii]